MRYKDFKLHILLVSSPEKTINNLSRNNVHLLIVGDKEDRGVLHRDNYNYKQLSLSHLHNMKIKVELRLLTI